MSLELALRAAGESPHATRPPTVVAFVHVSFGAVTRMHGPRLLSPGAVSLAAM